MHIDIMASMSTPVNQITSNPNFNTTQPKMEDDPLVMGVIDEMEQEVSRSHQQQQQQHQHPQNMQQQPDMRTTNVAAFRHEGQQPNQYMYPQQMSAPAPPPHPPQHYNKKREPSMFEWNQEDATVAVVIAVVAFFILSFLNVSFIYDKYIVLSTFQPYDIYIKTVVLAATIYLLIRKFKST